MIQSTLFDDIKWAQVGDIEVERIKVNIRKEKVLGFVEDEQGVIRLQNRLHVPQRMQLIERIMSDAKYSIHTGGTKMYIDLRQAFWCSNMK